MAGQHNMREGWAVWREQGAADPFERCLVRLLPGWYPTCATSSRT